MEILTFHVRATINAGYPPPVVCFFFWANVDEFYWAACTSCKWLAFVLWTRLNLPRGNNVVATLCWTHLNSIARDYFVHHSLFPPSYIQFNCPISSGLPFSNLNVLIHEIRISGNIVGEDSDIFTIPHLFWVIM